MILSEDNHILKQSFKTKRGEYLPNHVLGKKLTIFNQRAIIRTSLGQLSHKFSRSHEVAATRNRAATRDSSQDHVSCDRDVSRISTDAFHKKKRMCSR